MPFNKFHGVATASVAEEQQVDPEPDMPKVIYEEIQERRPPRTDDEERGSDRRGKRFQGAPEETITDGSERRHERCLDVTNVPITAVP